MTNRLLPLSPVTHRRYQPRPLLVLPSLLGMTALVFFITLVLPWHHHDIPGGGYTVLYGYQDAIWIAIAGLPVAAYAVRFSRWGFGRWSRLYLSLIAVFVAIGMWLNYLDAMSAALAVSATPWFGPGFALGSAGTLLLLIASGVSWRTDD